MGAAFARNSEKTAIINTMPGNQNCNPYSNYSVFRNNYGNYGNCRNYGNFGHYGGYRRNYGYGHDTRLSPYEIRMLKDHFDSIAGIDRKLSFQEFVILFGRLNPHLTGPLLVNMAERAFIYYDTNRSGYMGFDEFVSYFLDARSSYDNNSYSNYGYVRRRPRYESPSYYSSGIRQRLRPRSREIIEDYVPRERERIEEYVPRPPSRRLLEIKDRDDELYRDDKLPYKRRSRSSSLISANRGRKKVDFADEKDDKDPFGTRVIHKDTVEFV